MARDEPPRRPGAPALSPAARALAAQCEPRVNELARHLARGAFEQLRGYAELPADVKDVEIAATARHALRLFLRTAVHGSPSEGLEFFEERAAQRAEEGMPLHLLLRTYCLGIHQLWQALRSAARPGEEPALAELAEALFAAEERVVGAVTESYLDEQAALAAERHERRRSRARALLDGTAAPDASAPDGPALVLHLSFPDARDARSPVAVRRLHRRVQTALDRAFGTEALALLDATGGHVVVPGTSQLPDRIGEVLREAVAGPGLRLAADAVPDTAGIPRAARLTAEVVRIAAACGRPPGLHRLDDVLLEYHLSRPSEGSGRIAARLDPLAGRPDLLDTLRTHLAQRQDRRATARLLSLHPNSVDNRLTRIQELTGLDLADPRDTALALAALLLKDAPVKA
ncbi:CdaR family transcriptional regulator [Streptomyces sp. Ag109_G2-15]|uniref:PucR family transcriptional regulator n=1 Tax=Streptomyces sp. Ag109_G2-15 TaxID=1938850 RepID=UPI000BD47908|nr:helix-turn-helix domain-containing protein [Streptomyces sp. Ag109_G2-15]SOD84781.1 PucR C-terminal helix-turn-helix domain-containing protein [Streptomyces sp. Ag109_G2-15]